MVDLGTKQWEPVRELRSESDSRTNENPEDSTSSLDALPACPPTQLSEEARLAAWHQYMVIVMVNTRGRGTDWLGLFLASLGLSPLGNETSILRREILRSEMNDYAIWGIAIGSLCQFLFLPCTHGISSQPYHQALSGNEHLPAFLQQEK